jgi:hypothetical protein
MSTTLPGLLDADLPKGVRSRFVDRVNGLRMHVLEAGFETKGRPLVLLLHGFPELAYSWRNVMPALIRTLGMGTTQPITSLCSFVRLVSFTSQICP